MPKKSIKAEVKSFVGGLITEASVLNFPPNASVDEVNFVLNRDGTRNRRLGMNYEHVNAVQRLYSYGDPALTANGVSVFKWINVGGTSGKNFIVVQLFDRLEFYDSSEEYWSTDGYIGYLDISSLGTVPSDTIWFVAVDGKLVVVSGKPDIGVVTYDGTTFTLSTFRLKTRDVWGVEAAISEEDASLRPIAIPDDTHRYNLYNQGWGIPRGVDHTNTVYDPIVSFNTELSLYPSNSDSVWTGMQFEPVSGVHPAHERMYYNLFKQTTGTTGPVAKGYFLIDVLERGASRISAVEANADKYPELNLTTITGFPEDYTTGGAKVACEYSGRVFYAGFNNETVDGDSRSPNLSNFIFFSQLVKSSSDIHKCYQEGDPTSRETNDIVDTDGGFVKISGAGNIVALCNLEAGLLVLADNGMWVVSGGGDYGFTASNYKVSKISDFGCISPRSVVYFAGTAYVWTVDGIYAIVYDKTAMGFAAQSISHTTIQKFYDAIPSRAKQYCFGIADANSRTIRWVYNEGIQFTETSVTKELVFDPILKAFYPNKIANVGTEIYGAATTSPDLRVKYLVMISKLAGMKYYTFAEYNDETFTDWKYVNGIGTDAKAYLVTGAITADDSSVAKQVPFLTMHFERTEDGVNSDYSFKHPSGCLIRSMWDFTNTAAANKWGPLTQAYRYRRAYIPTGLTDTVDTGYEVVTSRNKLRGRGKSFSLYLETEVGKDCKVIGWNLNLNGNPET